MNRIVHGGVHCRSSLGGFHAGAQIIIQHVGLVVSLCSHAVAVAGILCKTHIAVLGGHGRAEDHKACIVAACTDHFLPPVSQDITVKHGCAPVAAGAWRDLPGGCHTGNIPRCRIPLFNFAVIVAFAHQISVPPESKGGIQILLADFFSVHGPGALERPALKALMIRINISHTAPSYIIGAAVRCGVFPDDLPGVGIHIVFQQSAWILLLDPIAHHFLAFLFRRKCADKPSIPMHNFVVSPAERAITVQAIAHMQNLVLAVVINIGNPDLVRLCTTAVFGIILP